jgi:hypothetical protein
MSMYSVLNIAFLGELLVSHRESRARVMYEGAIERAVT